MDSQNKYRYIFSVVAYNAPEYYDRFLRNLEWTKKRKEILISIVDNSPTDEIEKITGRYDLNIYYERTNNNLGYGKGHNRTYKITKSKAPEYYFILNPDIIIEESEFEILVQKIEENKKIGIIAPSIIDENGVEESSVFTDPSGFRYFLNFTSQALNKNANKRLGLTTPQESMSVKGVTGACMMIRKDAVISKKLFDTDYFMYFEDLDLCSRIRNNHWEIYYLKEAEVLHSVGKSSEHLPQKELWRKEMMYRSLHLYFNKNKSGLDQIFLNFSLKTALNLRILLRKDSEWAKNIKKEVFNPVTI